MYIFVKLGQNIPVFKIVVYLEVRKMPKNNKLVAAGSNSVLDSMKAEIASEFGVNLGPETTARQNGSVGGEITKRLVSKALGQSVK